jgi:sodium-dependent phosphate cotransporter
MVMTSSAESIVAPVHSSRSNPLVTWLGVAFFTYLILLSVGTVGAGFKWLSGGTAAAAELFSFATNPFLGLLIGVLATALVQSSSTVTSVIVGLVAGGLPIASAIPMVMGANIGTTITNTLVSLGHIRDKEEFKRAFSAATVHDFFNLICVVIFLPLELMFGVLEKISHYFAGLLVGGESLSVKSLNFIKPITKPVIGEFKTALSSVFPETFAAVAMILFGVVLIFVAITMIGRLLKHAMVGRAKRILHTAIGRGPLSGITSGAVVTVLVQSSSTTTSLAVPLAGSGVFKPRDIYPFTLGANIGTTITALLASTAVTGPGAVLSLQIALVHLFYNLLGVALIFGTPFLREIPLMLAQRLANFASEKHTLAALYVFAVFFGIPGICLFVSTAL